MSIQIQSNKVDKSITLNEYVQASISRSKRNRGTCRITIFPILRDNSRCFTTKILPLLDRIKDVSQKLQKFFWKPLFSIVHVTLIIMSRKYIYIFFAARAREWELCLQRYVSRMTRTKYFLNQNFSVHQCPAESANVRPSPPMSVNIR